MSEESQASNAYDAQDDEHRDTPNSHDENLPLSPTGSAGQLYENAPLSPTGSASHLYEDENEECEEQVVVIQQSPQNHDESNDYEESGQIASPDSPGQEQGSPIDGATSLVVSASVYHRDVDIRGYGEVIDVDAGSKFESEDKGGYSDDDGPSGSFPTPKKTRALIDSDDDDSGQDNDPLKRNVLGSDGSDDEEEDSEKQKTGGLMSNIFGNSDDDYEKDNQEHPIQNESDTEKEKDEDDERQKVQANDDDDDDEDSDGKFKKRGENYSEDFEWDFDVMMRNKKAERKRRTRKRDGEIDIINDDDGEIMKLVDRMKSAAKHDRASNMERKPAFQKVKMLPEVKAILLRANITDALIENGMMDVISEWLAPLPDKCLPALDIRVTVLKLLHNPRFWKLDRSVLKKSGLGKAVMLLYKHPSETRENKIIANKLIGEWARPIFQLDTDFTSMSKEERVHRDMERMPAVKKQRLSIDSRDESDTGLRDGDLELRNDGSLRPGDKGYIIRARVPRPSTKDYVVRPKWNIEGEFKGERKSTSSSRYDQTFREFTDRTRKNNSSRAVKVSLEGRNMAL